MPQAATTHATTVAIFNPFPLFCLLFTAGVVGIPVSASCSIIFPFHITYVSIITHLYAIIVKYEENPITSVLKGIVTRESGAKPKPHEYITAEALADSGYNVRFVPSSVNISMADCYINNTLFEIKAPEGKTTDCIERNLRKAVEHQSPNIVLDSFRMKNIQDKSIQNVLLDHLKRRHGI